MRKKQTKLTPHRSRNSHTIAKTSFNPKNARVFQKMIKSVHKSSDRHLT